MIEKTEELIKDLDEWRKVITLAFANKGHKINPDTKREYKEMLASAVLLLSRMRKFADVPTPVNSSPLGAFHLFAGVKYYPSRGAEDFIKSFNSVGDAIAYHDARNPDEDDCTVWDWALVTNANMDIIKIWETYMYTRTGEGSGWVEPEDQNKWKEKEPVR